VRILLLLVASCVAQEPKWSATASCTMHTSAGTECFEYDLTMPAERDQLHASCSAPGSTWADSDSCETDNRIGGCELDKGLLHGTFIYAGYQDVAGFMQRCTADDGTWNP
jgi:hypothetical protein